jgi:hypothetical protein
MVLAYLPRPDRRSVGLVHPKPLRQHPWRLVARPDRHNNLVAVLGPRPHCLSNRQCVIGRLLAALLPTRPARANDAVRMDAAEGVACRHRAFLPPKGSLLRGVIDVPANSNRLPVPARSRNVVTHGACPHPATVALNHALLKPSQNIGRDSLKPAHACSICWRAHSRMCRSHIRISCSFVRAPLR